MQFQNYDYTQPFKPKQDRYDGMVVYDKQFGVENERDERYEAGKNLGPMETAPLRIVSFGSVGVGLSSFILKCVYNEFSDEPEESKLLQWDDHQFEYIYENNKIRISFSDLKGFDSSLSQTEMINTITHALEYSNVILLFYSITSENSFIGNYSVQNIKTEIDKALIKLDQKKIILLIGTKLDLENERVITYQQGEELANIYGEIPFFEISNKHGTNIKQVIEIICEIYKYDNIIDKQETDNNINGVNGALDVPEITVAKEQQLINSGTVRVHEEVDYEHNILGDDDRDSIDDTELFIGDKMTFSPHCCCCSWIEHCLLNYSCCGTFCGIIFYIPFMLILYILWLLQIPLTLIINLIAFIFCCNFCKCECCRGSLFIADDESIPNAHYGVMLHTAESIRHLHLNVNSSGDHDNKLNHKLLAQMSPNSPSNNDQNQDEKVNFNINNKEKENNLQQQSISILQWNIFGQLGRYWKRYPLLTTTINDLDPDILCLQECVTSKWWRFGTINTIKKINPKYRGFHVSAYNVLHDYNKLFFQYSCCWRTINEFQSCCNLYCLIPFWKQNIWKYALHSNGCCTILFNTFSGIIAQIGNAIVFKNNFQLFRSYIPLQPGNRRVALRSLYILKDINNNNQQIQIEKPQKKVNAYGQRLSVTMKKDKTNNKIKKKQRKKIWIVCTHLSPDKFDDKSEEITTQQVKQIIKWMDDAQNKICKADATIICGDFNCTPQSNVYNIMIENGYKSAVKTKKGKELWTFPTDTWKYDRNEESDIGNKVPKDYIWIKSDCNINIQKIRLIGREYKDSTHKGDAIKIYPSDHLGIYMKLSI